jgi:protein-disulfide isomerase
LRNRASAPVTCEIFIDYQCPPCARFLTETVPILEEQYVQTGKIRLLYRDFPQPQHRFAKLAALYINAAGQLGYSDRARSQILTTQSTWAETGEIDAQIASALPPEIMPKVRNLVDQNQKINASIDTDLAAARNDHLTNAPSVVIVYKGNRQVMPPDVTIDQLKRYLDHPVPY